MMAAVSESLLPPVAVASLALLLVGGLGLLIGGLDDGVAVTVMAVVVLLVAAGLGVRHLAGVLAGGGAAAAPPPHRTIAWIALGAAVAAVVVAPVLFTIEEVPGWVAVVAVADGVVALPVSLAALRGARSAGDGAGARLAAFAAGAGVVVLILLVAMGITAIGIASSFS